MLPFSIETKPCQKARVIYPIQPDSRQKKALRVYANDLNPDSFRWLKHNTTANKVADRMELHNVDGREFIQSVVRDVIQKRLLQARHFFSWVD